MNVREIVYNFFLLPYIHRIKILLELKLVEESEITDNDNEVYKLSFRRARERNQVSELRNLVDKFKRKYETAAS